MTALMSCPFCGGEAEVAKIDTIFCHGFVARCMNDDCLMTAETMCLYPTETEAAEVWNTRAERTCRMELTAPYGNFHDVWRCGECGGETLRPTVMSKSEPPNYCPECGARIEKGADR